MAKMNRYALAIDLVNDEKLIAEYEAYHKSIWPEITQSIKSAGIINMEIYRVANRLFMMMEVGDNFSFEAKDKADKTNPKVQEWEALMWKYQQALPIAKKGEKWLLMERIFAL